MLLALFPVLALATVPPAGLRGGLVRPSLSGPVVRLDVDGFRIHYTLEGRDAAPPLDVDGNGQPDIVDRVIEGLELGRTEFVDEGWRGLIEDNGAGGSPALDVYLRTLPVNGYAYPVAQGDDQACFIEIDPGLSTASGIAISVAVHELHHCVQFRYNAGLPSWLYEAASTYEQFSTVTDPALDLAVRLLYLDELSAMDTPLASVTGDNDPYTAFLWMKFWSELDSAGPDVARLPALWEDLSGDRRWRAMLDEASNREFGLPLELTYLLYATWNGFACGADTGQLYDSDVLPCGATVSVPVEALQIGETVHVEHEEGPFTAHYLEVAVDEHQVLQLTCAGSDVYAAWIGLEASGELSHVHTGLDASPTLQIGVPPGGAARAVVVGTRGPLDAHCTVTPAEPPDSAGCHASPAGRLGWLWVLGGLLVRRRRRAPDHPQRPAGPPR